MKPSKAVDVMDALIAADLPMMLWGAPGTGKTSFVRKWGEDRGYQVLTFLGSLHEPTDIGGMPYVIDEASFGHALPAWYTRIVEGGEDERWIIFLDELNTSSAEVMAAMLLLVQNREIRGVKLPSTTRIIAAGNPPETMTLALPLPTAMQSRVAHIEWEAADPEEALAGELNDWPTPSPSGFELDDVETARWKSLIASFKAVRPSLADTDLTSDGNVADAGRGYPCLRSWSHLGNALGCIGSRSKNDTLAMNLSSAIVGDGPGKEFIHYCKDLDLPDPGEWIGNPDLAEPLSDDSRTSAALMAVAVEAIKRGSSPSVWGNAVKAICKIADARTPGLCMPAMHLLVQPKNMPRTKSSANYASAVEAAKNSFGDLMSRVQKIG